MYFIFKPSQTYRKIVCMCASCETVTFSCVRVMRFLDERVCVGVGKMECIVGSWDNLTVDAFSRRSAYLGFKR